MEADRFTPESRDQRPSGKASEIATHNADFSLSIVVPVYKEEGNVPEFLNRIAEILNSITSKYEIVFCLDPSPDRTEEVILQAREKDFRVKLLKFSRRFGQPMATLAGLQYSNGDAAIVMDVYSGGPADKAGIVIGDILISLAGHAVTRLEDIQSHLAGDAIGNTLPLKFVRGGVIQEGSIVVAERPHGGQ